MLRPGNVPIMNGVAYFMYAQLRRIKDFDVSSELVLVASEQTPM